MVSHERRPASPGGAPAAAAAAAMGGRGGGGGWRTYQSSVSDTGIGLPPFVQRMPAGAFPSCGAPSNTSAEPTPTAVLRGEAPGVLLRSSSVPLRVGASTEEGAEAWRDPYGPGGGGSLRCGAVSSRLRRGLFGSGGPAGSSASTAGPCAESSSGAAGPGGLGAAGASTVGPGTTSSALAVPGGVEGRLFVVVACAGPANNTAAS